MNDRSYRTTHQSHKGIITAAASYIPQVIGPPTPSHCTNMADQDSLTTTSRQRRSRSVGVSSGEPGPGDSRAGVRGDRRAAVTGDAPATGDAAPVAATAGTRS